MVDLQNRKFLKINHLDGSFGKLRGNFYLKKLALYLFPKTTKQILNKMI